MEPSATDDRSEDFNPPWQDQPPPEVQDQLDLLSLHWWAECRALICTVCKPDDMTYTSSMLSRTTALEHLESFHNFRSDTQTKALEKCLDKLPSLAFTPAAFGDPIRDLPPREFLAPPRKGWSCTKCPFCTDDFRENKFHSQNRHHLVLKWNDFPFHQAMVQNIDGRYFPVKVERAVSSSREEPSLHTGLPRMLQFWIDCNAIVCVACPHQPMLSRKDVISHLEGFHAADEVCQDFPLIEKRLDNLWALADDSSEIRLPRPLLGENHTLSSPEKGWECSFLSCGYANPSPEDLDRHGSDVHGGVYIAGKRWKQVMVQFVTLGDKKIYFTAGEVDKEPAFPISTDQNCGYPETIETSDRDSGSESSKDDEGNASSSEHVGIVQPLPGFGKFKPKLVKTGSPFKDTYSLHDRKEILAGLWNSPSDSDLEPLTPKQTQQKIRELALRDRIEGVKEVRRFHNVHLQAILTTQHEIIQLEERMSRGGPIAIDKLNPLLIEYANLIKAYKELSALKQVHKDGKSFSKFFATELHEPRYWYAPDATERIDLIEDSPRVSHDIVRKVLQQKLPLRWLDAAGRAMREWDQAEDEVAENDRGQFGPVSRITSRYRSHGRYISPSVDNLARVLFALCGGLFLLIPMVALAYIKSKTWLVVTTVLFVLGFAVMLGGFSKGTNHELIGATAAYAAVLVVFVGNSISGGKG